jgi:hypothetical protein
MIESETDTNKEKGDSTSRKQQDDDHEMNRSTTVLSYFTTLNETTLEDHQQRLTSENRKKREEWIQQQQQHIPKVENVLTQLDKTSNEPPLRKGHEPNHDTLLASPLSVRNYDDHDHDFPLNQHHLQLLKDSSDKESTTSSCHNNNNMIESKKNRGRRNSIMATIGKKETKTVSRLRIVLLLVLLISSVIVGSVTYRYVTEQESSSFENDFKRDVNKLFEGIGQNLIGHTLGTMDLFTSNVIRVASITNQSWPFVTIPFFEDTASKVRTITDGIVFSINIVVTPDQRNDWEDYALDTYEEWMNQTMNLQQEQYGEQYFGPINFTFTPIYEIYGDAGVIPYNTT